MVDRTRHVIIVGGGIAGLSTALALQRAGITFEVFEARPRLSGEADGLFLNMASNGLAVLSFLGVADPVQRAGAPCPHHALWSARGRELGRVTNGSPRTGTPSVLVRRDVVQRALSDAVAATDVTVRHGASLIAIEDDGSGVTAHFSGGRTARGDVLLGCDGIHSRTRRLLDPCSPRPAYTSMVCVGGLARTPGLPRNEDTLNLVFGQRAFFGYLTTGEGLTYWFSNVLTPDEPRQGSLRGTSATEWQERLLRLHDGDMAPISAVLSAPQELVAAYPIYDMPRVPVWNRGRAAILGDAAHATSPHAGQGASMALEDSLAMAVCLRDAADPQRAFRRFEQSRRERVDRIVSFSRRMGQNKALNGRVAVALRDALMPLVLRHFATPERRAWIYEHPLDWTSRPLESA
jgi:FAD-dependent urate hydroxylase